MRKPSVNERFHYWFDNRMSRGSKGMIGILVLVTLMTALLATLIIMLFGLNGGLGIPAVFWDMMATIMNKWMPFFEDHSIGYLLVMAAASLVGLLVTSILIGIITNSIQMRVEGLRKGNSIVLEKNHIIVIGFYAGEYTLLRQLILSAGKRKCTIVIGGEMEKTDMEQYIQDNIVCPDNVTIICRTIDPYDPETLRRLSVETCRTILISPTDDRTAIKMMLAASSLVSQSGNKKVNVHAVTRSSDSCFPAEVAALHRIVTVQINEMVAAILSHSCTQSGLAAIYREIANFEGSEIYLTQLPNQGGHTFMELMAGMDHAVPIGLYREGKPNLNPPADFVVEDTDKLLVFAEDKDSAVLADQIKLFDTRDHQPVILPKRPTSVMIFGCNNTMNTVLQEIPDHVQCVMLVNYGGDDVEEFRKICDERDMELKLLKADTSNQTELFEILRLCEHVLVLSSHEIDEDDADMETMIMLLRLRELRIKYNLRFNTVAEMHREKNHNMVMPDDSIEYIVASYMQSLFVAQLADNSNLLPAFKELLSNEGNGIYIRRAEHLFCTGTFTVAELRQLLYSQRYIFLGYSEFNGEFIMNPPRNKTVEIDGSDRIIVLSEKSFRVHGNVRGTQN